MPAAGIDLRRSTSTTISVAGSASITSRRSAAPSTPAADRHQPVLHKIAVVAEDVEKLGKRSRRRNTLLIAQTACSRDEPAPNAGPATRIDAPWYCSWLRTRVAVAPRREQPLLEARSARLLQPFGGDDLVGNRHSTA
jgi:hypothetical protein